MLLHKQPPIYIDKILRNVNRFYEEHNNQVAIFHKKFVLDFIHHQIINFNNLTVEPDQDTFDPIIILKAFLIFTETIAGSHLNDYETKGSNETDVQFFRRAFWPSIFEQSELQYRPEMVSYSYVIIGATILEELRRDVRYKKYVDRFLRNFNFSSRQYFTTIINLLVRSLPADLNKATYFNTSLFNAYNALIYPTDSTQELLNSISLDIDEYRHYFKDGVKNYNGFKSRPVITFNDGQNYLVIDWSFLFNKCSDGMLFDFYQHSGIAEETEFKDFLLFKKFKADVLEKILLRNIFRKLFPTTKGKLLFAENKSASTEPDVYYRCGKRVAIIEFKDAAIAGEKISSYSYEEIIKAIDEKYNLPNKGTGQLVNFLKFYNSSKDFEGDPTYRFKLSRDLIVYPIIIYTDKSFSCAGVNDYLADAFEEKLRSSQLQSKFLSVKRLVCLDFNKLLTNFISLSQNSSSLFDLIDTYNERIKKRKARNLTSDISLMRKAQINIEDELLDKLCDEVNSTPNYIEKLLQQIEIQLT
ncbi:MAG: hypothetical protein JST76_11995 [Bacteroidetes bacterium]|nr:hypothetical protein [Bacteroidota bacterium]